MSNDWIEHNGGPQPVDDDVWVQVWRKYSGHDRSPSMAAGFDWPDSVRSFRILNQHLIDAARIEGIRLGLEAAVKMASQTIIAARTGQIGTDLRGISNVIDRDIRALDPETIAKEADREPR